MNYQEIEVPKKYSMMVEGVEFILDTRYEFIGICIL